MTHQPPERAAEDGHHDAGEDDPPDAGDERDGALVVVDRGSTNGSTVTTPDGVTTPCVPEQRVPAPEGAVVSMGDHWLTVRQD